MTAGDVLHSFAIPAFGMKTDAVPGRMNETWVRIEEEGTYYGQCSEDLWHRPRISCRSRCARSAARRFDDWVVERTAGLDPGGAAGPADPDLGRRDGRARRGAGGRRVNSPWRRARARAGRRHSDLKRRGSSWRKPGRTPTTTTTTSPGSSSAGCSRRTTRTLAPSIWSRHRGRAPLIGGIFSLLMRMELQDPGLQGRRRRAAMERLDHGPRPDHGVLRGHAGNDRRVRQLVRAADDRRAGHGLPRG